MSLVWYVHLLSCMILLFCWQAGIGLFIKDQYKVIAISLVLTITVGLGKEMIDPVFSLDDFMQNGLGAAGGILLAVIKEIPVIKVIKEIPIRK